MIAICNKTHHHHCDYFCRHVNNNVVIKKILYFEIDTYMQRMFFNSFQVRMP